MKILALERENPRASADAFKPHLGPEAARVWELHQAGIIRELYFREDRSEAVLMLECASIEKAQEILSSLPLVKERLIAFEIIPLKPYSGFSRLFSSE